MAAYAALVSLMNNMEQIKNHPRLSTCLDKSQIESLGENVDFLLDFVESYNPHGDGGIISKEEVEDLESRIASAAHAAEDVVESHVVDQIVAGSTEGSPSFLIDLQKIIQDMDSIKEKAMEVKEIWALKTEQITRSTPATLSRPLNTGENTMVGFDDILLELVDKLVGTQSSRQIIPIVGIGGIGKTTVARNVYENIVIMQHFDILLWATVSVEYNVREILLNLLSCLRESTDKIVEGNADQLGELLYKILSGKRYLIILDDMWSIEVWDMIKFLLPDNKNGSRIIVTTTLSNLAFQFGSVGFVMKFLDEERSWDLFCQKAFGPEGCPPELEEIAEEIVRNCGGLPLAIVVIGGLLAKSSRTQEYWRGVAENISSITNSSDNNQLLNILSMSYSQLPAYLKPCFIYMGIFPEDHEIRVSRLIRLWVAEGFLRPSLRRSLEDIAEDYIKDLVDRNLILVCRLGSNGKLKTCKIHDLLRDLCVRIAKKEKFLGVTRILDTPQDIDRERRIVIQGSTTEKHYDPQVFHNLESTPLARSLVCESPALLSFSSGLLRVLIEVYSDSLDATFEQVNLRFLAYESIHAPIGWISTYELPSSISLLWSVQTLIIDKSIDKVVAPSEIWEMPQLRHLKFYRIFLPDPPPCDEQDYFVLRNLHTLGTVLDFTCSEEVCKRIPNIKKLRVLYDDFTGEGETSSWYCLHNVGHFYKLQSLYCCFHVVPNRDDLLQNLRFPSSLKKLTLQDCELHWSDLTIIGSLPVLEVLKLKCQSVRGSEWNPVEGQFLCLKFLEIDSCYLIYWNADSYHFPVLENLVLGRLYRLKEIPSGIGDIPTLRDISMVECSVSATISAITILQEQESWGNDCLQVRVKFRKKAKVEEFMQKVRREGFTTTSRNLKIDGV